MSSQTETAFPDEEIYREAVRRLNSAELRREEMNEVLDGLSDQVVVKAIVIAKMQSELDATRHACNSLFSENSSLTQQLRSFETTTPLTKTRFPPSASPPSSPQGGEILAQRDRFLPISRYYPK